MKDAKTPAISMKLADPESGLLAYIVVDEFANGIAGGGMRMSLSVTEEEVRRLAEVMTYKWAAMGIPIGGAKMGIVGDPRNPKKRQQLKILGKLAKPLLSSSVFTGPDMGISSDELGALFDEVGIDTVRLVMKHLRTQGKVKVPKTVRLSDLGGRHFEELITGYGVACATDEAFHLMGNDIEGATVSIQGFGAVGMSAANYLHEMGARIVCISDAKGSVFERNGLDVPSLAKNHLKGGLINRRRLPRTVKRFKRDYWLSPRTDILIPAAVADAINSSNISRVKASLIVEGANIPASFEMEERLHKKRVFVVPDFIANAGLVCGFGVIVTGAVTRGQKEVFEETERRIRRAIKSVFKISQRKSITPRSAAIGYARKEKKKIG